MKGRIVLLGPPASGKGTQAEMIKANYQIEAVSPGAMLREEKNTGTQLGIEADKLTSKGQLVPDSMIVSLVESWLQKHDGKFVFDGFPRTIGQADALSNILAGRRTPLDVAFFLDVDFETIRDRVARRMVCKICGNIVSMGLHIGSSSSPCPRCGGHLHRRNDDDEKTLRRRMIEYREKSETLVSHYAAHGLLERINANRTPSEVFLDIAAVLEK